MDSMVQAVRLTGQAALDALEAHAEEGGKAELIEADVEETTDSYLVRIPKRISAGALKMSTSGKSLVATVRTSEGISLKTTRSNGSERTLAGRPFNINLTFKL